MENIIGFLIILVSIIISIISSVNKKSRQKTAPVTTASNEETQGFSADLQNEQYNFQSNAAITDSPDMTVEEKRKQIEAKKYSDYERQKETQQEAPDEETEVETEETEVYEEEEDISSEEKPAKEEKQSDIRQPAKTIGKQPAKKRRKRKSTPVEEIQRDFNLEKGILYTEILNRKHF